MDGSLIPSTGKIGERVHGFSRNSRRKQYNLEGWGFRKTTRMTDDIFSRKITNIHVHLIFGNVTGWWEDPKFTLSLDPVYPTDHLQEAEVEYELH